MIVPDDVKTADFDCVARVYRWAEYFALGTLLKRTREHFLPCLQDRRKALLFGDGDGRFLAKLLHSNSSLCGMAIDTSGTMLSLLRTRCALHLNRIETKQASALTVTPAPDTDLIVSHFFLDCLTFEQVAELVKRVSATVRPGSVWLISDFAVPQRRLLRSLASMYIRMLYFSFRITTGLQVRSLPDIEGPMLHAGFLRTARRTFLFGVLYTELWTFQGRRDSNPSRAAR